MKRQAGSPSSKTGGTPVLRAPHTLARGGPYAEALEQNILSRLVALNHERAAEEKRGLIPSLRPDFQAPQSSDFSRRGKVVTIRRYHPRSKASTPLKKLKVESGNKIPVFQPSSFAFGYASFDFVIFS